MAILTPIVLLCRECLLCVLFICLHGTVTVTAPKAHMCSRELFKYFFIDELRARRQETPGQRREREARIAAIQAEAERVRADAAEQSSSRAEGFDKLLGGVSIFLNNILPTEKAVHETTTHSPTGSIYLCA